MIKEADVGMNYQSPIEVIQSQMRSQIEDEIYKAVMKVGVNVDKDELLKALQYDRGQYQKGYTDRDSEIVRCKDCKHGAYVVQVGMLPFVTCCGVDHELDWFCADGERW